MKRFIILASLLLVTFSCSKEPVESTDQNKESLFTITANLPGTQTRLKPNTDNNEGWTFSWEQYDDMGNWHTGCTKLQEFVNNNATEKTAYFKGTLGEGEKHRFIHPYEKDVTFADGSTLYPINISEQDGALNKTYFISQQLYAKTQLTEGTVKTLPMEHVGGFMVVDIYLENGVEGSTYTLKKVKYSGIPTQANIDLEQAFDSQTLLDVDEQEGTVTINVDEKFETAEQDPEYLQAITRMNIIPFTLGADESVSIEIVVDVNDGSTTSEYVSSIVVTADSAVDFARATHNFTYLTADAANSAQITGATINDWTQIDKGDLPSAQFEYEYTAADIDADNIPVVSTWNIVDEGKLTKDLLKGVRAALDVAKSEGRTIKLNFPNATSIDYAVFSSWNNFTSINLPKVTEIGSSSFEYCESLTEVTNLSVTSIPYYAFSRTGITSFDFTGVTEISEEAFSNCKSLTTVTNFNVASIPDGAFKSAGLTSFDFAGVTSMGEEAFYGCKSLTTVTNFNVASIPERAFQYSGLTSFDFTGVTSIGENAFGPCESLTTVTNLNGVSISNSAFYKSGLTSFDFTGVASVGEHVFNSCKDLKTVTNFDFDTIPKCLFRGSGLTTFDFAGVTSIGEYAFDNCKDLKTVTNFNLDTVACQLFSESGLTTFDFAGVTCIESGAFANCADLTNVTNLSVASIPGFAFYEAGLTSFDFSTVTSIGEYAFAYCYWLKDVELPSTLTSISPNAFYGESIVSLTLNWTGDDILTYDSDWGIKPYGTTIYIPVGTIDAYKAKEWGVYTLVEKTE